jgi:RNA polymerase sigma factor (sigma-70 family)
LFQLRGFAWADEAPLTPTGSTPVLSDAGNTVGVVDTEHDAVDQDDFSIFDAIIPLSGDQRRSVLTQLAEVECITLVNALGSLDEHDRERVGTALQAHDDGASITSLLDNPGATVGSMGRKRRTELIGVLRTAFHQVDLSPDILGAFEEGVEEVRRLRAVAFRDSARLAAKIAAKHRGGLDWSTAFLAACEGLVIGLDRFEPWRGYEFSTYATYWIRHYVRRYRQNRATALRIPVHVRERIYDYTQAERDLWTGDLRPTVRAVVEALGEIGPAAERAIVHAGPVLDAGVDDGRSTSLALAEQIHDAGILPLWDGGPPAVWPGLAVEQLRAAVANIGDATPKGERIRNIVWRRLAVDRNRAQTLQEIGDDFGISRERVRQLESRALGVLKLDHVERGADVCPWRWRHWK